MSQSINNTLIIKIFRIPKYKQYVTHRNTNHLNVSTVRQPKKIQVYQSINSRSPSKCLNPQNQQYVKPLKNQLSISIKRTSTNWILSTSKLSTERKSKILRIANNQQYVKQSKYYLSQSINSTATNKMLSIPNYQQ